MKKFVAVAGNIGVGKSTLVKMLCDEMDWDPFYEPVTENPYLADFYQNMSAWAFHSQVFFLTHRLRSHMNLALNPNSVIQDRSVYEDAEIFAQNLYDQGNIPAYPFAKLCAIIWETEYLPALAGDSPMIVGLSSFQYVVFFPV